MNNFRYFRSRAIQRVPSRRGRAVGAVAVVAAAVVLSGCTDILALRRQPDRTSRSGQIESSARDKSVVVHAEGGTASRDWVPEMAADRAQDHPTTVVIAFAGNIATCVDLRVADEEARRPRSPTTTLHSEPSAKLSQPSGSSLSARSRHRTGLMVSLRREPPVECHVPAGRQGNRCDLRTLGRLGPDPWSRVRGVPPSLPVPGTGHREMRSRPGTKIRRGPSDARGSTLVRLGADFRRCQAVMDESSASRQSHSLRTDNDRIEIPGRPGTRTKITLALAVATESPA